MHKPTSSRTNVTDLAAKLIATDLSLKPPETTKLIRHGSDLSPDGRFRLINPRRVNRTAQEAGAVSLR